MARQALAEIIEGRMREAVDEHMERMAELGTADRRNGSDARHLPTTSGDIEQAVPRTRTFGAGGVIQAYARREPEVDRMIISCFPLGLSKADPRLLD